MAVSGYHSGEAPSTIGAATTTVAEEKLRSPQEKQIEELTEKVFILAKHAVALKENLSTTQHQLAETSRDLQIVRAECEANKSAQNKKTKLLIVAALAFVTASLLLSVGLHFGFPAMIHFIDQNFIYVVGGALAVGLLSGLGYFATQAAKSILKALKKNKAENIQNTQKEEEMSKLVWKTLWDAANDPKTKESNYEEKKIAYATNLYALSNCKQRQITDSRTIRLVAKLAKTTLLRLKKENKLAEARALSTVEKGSALAPQGDTTLERTLYVLAQSENGDSANGVRKSYGEMNDDEKYSLLISQVSRDIGDEDLQREVEETKAKLERLLNGDSSTLTFWITKVLRKTKSAAA